jgi:hypothetical protein
LGYSGYVKNPDRIFGRKVNLLDYGSGDGGYLEWVKGCNSKIGFDPFNSESSLSLDDVLNKKYDIITLNHVLEHLENPFDVISLLRERLNETGMIVILVPDKDSLMAKIFKKFWHCLDSPRRLHLATEEGVKSLCARAGLRYVEKKTFSLPNDYSASFLQAINNRFNIILFIIFLAPAIVLAFFNFKKLRSLARYTIIKSSSKSTTLFLESSCRN